MTGSNIFSVLVGALGGVALVQAITNENLLWIIAALPAAVWLGITIYSLHQIKVNFISWRKSWICRFQDYLDRYKIGRRKKQNGC